MKFLLLKEDSSLFFFSCLDSLHYFDKIYKDVRIVEYHFGSSNWSGTEVIDSGIRKRILTSKFSFPIYIGIIVKENVILVLHLLFVFTDRDHITWINLIWFKIFINVRIDWV